MVGYACQSNTLTVKKNCFGNVVEATVGTQARSVLKSGRVGARNARATSLWAWMRCVNLLWIEEEDAYLLNILM